MPVHPTQCHAESDSPIDGAGYTDAEFARSTQSSGETVYLNRVDSGTVSTQPPPLMLASPSLVIS
jgi:hypothetical protein